MTSQRGIERGRGAKESGQVFAALRARWPLAFPAQPRDVRPLASSVVGEIATAMGWSRSYKLRHCCARAGDTTMHSRFISYISILY